MSKVRFRTNALLKSIIGKDLITDDNIAVLELVKNSFDAGSQNVDIIFKNILQNNDSHGLKKPTKNSSQLIIQDRGIGMSESDLKDKWLNIAYSEKKEKREEFGRLLAGNKGVGRFSCDRLGRFLTIYTRKNNEDYKRLFIDWSLFEVDAQIDFNIQDVDFEIESLSEFDLSQQTDYQSFDNGTILEISHLREYWHSAKIVGLKRQLERLINPNQAFKRNQFGVKITASDFLQYDKGQEEYNKVNGEVKNRIFENLDFKTTSIHSSIDAKGEYITTTLKDRGTEVFILKENNPFSQLANVEITIFYLNTYAKAYFTKQTGIKSVDFGSIYLFINGFRIPPYGDDGDDWLGIEMRKGQGYSRFLGTREIVGRIEVFDEGERFKIISNRSGVVKNVAFEQLTKSEAPYGYYYKIFRRLERFVVEGIKWDSTPIDSSVIEKEVNDKKWDESKEKYTEDTLTRNKRALSVINNIIDVKRSEIVDLKINDEFVKQIIDEQSERVKSEFESMLSTLKEKSENISPQTIEEILSKISKSSHDIESFSTILSRYSDINSVQFQDLNTIQEALNLKYEELLKEKDQLELKLRQEKEARDKAQAEKEEAEKALELEREKNTYLRTSSRSLSEDAKGLVHNIKITSKKISDSVDNLYDKILNDNYTRNSLLKSLGAIKFQSEKAKKISNIITRSNFKADRNSQIADVVRYIEQYISIYSDIYPSNELEFKIIDNSSSLIKKFSILDISVVLDDLISNSEKAGSTLIEIEMTNLSENVLKILFHDNGSGVSKDFLKDEKSKEKIFELGVTTTKGGSGIGLNSVREALKSMGGTIKFNGNNVKHKGACFEIIIR
ncbi:ATP-binding protein [Sphingobacterium multivorum]|uniref:ATP-binding protein n=1 Tax=Sphingobacterium multivorum TaxID=28454 RepID=UPI0019194A20|nr:ATP-binding protein [Sphingobacterium multivorum]QQT62629.1 ATP-binding protein [Sphingobacterium multivorum]